MFIENVEWAKDICAILGSNLDVLMRKLTNNSNTSIMDIIRSTVLTLDEITFKFNSIIDI